MRNRLLLIFFLLLNFFAKELRAQCGSHPDYETLMALYDSTNGEGWINNSGWKEGKEGVSCDPCNGWYGVGCENGRVSNLNLRTNNLQGTLVDLSVLTELKIFNIFLNQVDGPIPNLSKNIKLEELICVGNKINGAIPDLSLNINLKYFDCGSNQITGVIPNLSKNINLKFFNCSSNQIIGEVPSLAYNEVLNTFRCEFNKITGVIPELSNNKDLERFDCSKNQIQGPIPNLLNNRMLHDFDCSNNKIVGGLPDLSNNLNLIIFRSAYNRIIGVIPDLSKNEKLLYFEIQQNEISGYIPDLSSNKMLKSFNCESNKLTGEIPVLSNNEFLNYFTCAENKIMGSIPSLSNNQRLTSFDCSRNQLTGEIPNLAMNTDLISFNCSSNQLIGMIPDLSNNSSLKSFRCDFNKLVGVIPNLSKNLNLDFFNCSNNLLASIIPDLSSNNLLKEFYCHSNKLFGEIPNFSNNKFLKTFTCYENQLSGCFNESICRDSLLFNSRKNPLLPWQGDNLRYCNGESQTGASCDDTDSTTINDLINSSCECEGEATSLCGSHPDYNTLMALYDSTNGDGWINNAGWKEGKAGTNCDPCKGWYGVYCNYGRVEYVKLDSNNLVGKLVPLDKLDSLITFRCAYNFLIDTIPNLSLNINLRDYNCGRNQLTGRIPDLFNNINLEWFNCTDNQLTGEIPNLSTNIKLTQFFCGSNKLSGAMPDFSSNTNLFSFACYNNNISGPISDLSKNINLYLFYCGFNKLTGTIPNLSNNVNLQWFNCEQNNIVGHIPDLSNNKLLINFSCAENQISGSIPDLSTNINLQSFRCDRNNISGEIQDLSKNKFLIEFSCAENQLSGCFNESICRDSLFFNSQNNTFLPWNGIHYSYCFGESQIGATCDDMDANTINDAINENCECKGIKRIQCDSIKLNIDYYIINENEKNTLDIFANDILTTQGLLSTDKVNINVVRSPNAPIVIKVDKDLVSVEVSSAWSDTIVLQYTLTRESCPNSTTSYIYLINKSVFEESLCSQITLKRDTYNGLKNEEILLDVVNNDLVNSIPFTQAEDLGIEYKISKFTLPKNVKSSLTLRSGEYYLTIEEDWIDTLFAKYEVCITAPCDTCMTVDIAFVNKALEDITLTTIFSPDGDGINDQLKFTTSSEIKDSEIWIFNRYGTQVYQKKDYTNDWDASGFGGGIYYYVLNYKGVQIKKLLTIVK